MEAIEIFLAVYLIISIVLFIRNKREIKRLDLRIKRIDDVHDFRVYVLQHYPFYIYEMLPEFDEMVDDGKELMLKSYIDVNALYSNN